MNLILEKRRELNLVTYIPFLAYEKAIDQVKRPILFNILHKRNNPDRLLSTLMKIYEHNEIEVSLNNKTTRTAEISTGIREGCPSSPTLFNIHINEVILEWDTDSI